MLIESLNFAIYNGLIVSVISQNSVICGLFFGDLWQIRSVICGFCGGDFLDVLLYNLFNIISISTN